MSTEPDFEHRMKNYLAIIVGYANLLKEDMPGEHPMQADVDEILKAARDATALLESRSGPQP